MISMKSQRSSALLIFISVLNLPKIEKIVYNKYVENKLKRIERKYNDENSKTFIYDSFAFS